jgi:hypothetical protein
MNYVRLLIAAVVASIVLIIGQIAFVLVIGTRLMAAREAAGLPPFVPQPLLSLLEVFLTGAFLVWLYAIMRSRFGPGVLTAIKAALAGWFAVVGLSTLHMVTENVGFPPALLLTVAIIIMPIFVFATVAGALIYRERAIP